MTNRTIPLAAMDKLLKKAGAERVADSAKRVLRDSLEGIAEDIASHATKLASHAGRKTIKSGDVRLAARD
ncbi:NFYB/HAP3 family transcription factor subunit [Candidatus Woesearchaeota archaeon]|nr:NFYB/HAP3 family transcription factor subunit [Candidatus Woesearchaeota archaeon]MBL7050554.1 NFYB/HAP3 family transcription factor subunit [Candidatus Woesearchaeota archaeon]